VTIRVIGFARARELLGDRSNVSLPSLATVADAWHELVGAVPALEELSGWVRFAVDGALVPPERPLHDGQELAVLPAVGGG
jgi:molybdopterin converting factor small subunit